MGTENRKSKIEDPIDLTDPKTLKDFLSRHGLRADKGLGQHFLCSKAAVQAVAQRLAGSHGVLEIGPGPGVLTGPLSEDRSLIALEVDERMIGLLAESAPSADVRKIDALKADLGRVLDELPEPRAVVSNLPYYITGPLLTRIAEARSHYQRAMLMMQREVADRVVAAPGDSNRGSLSVFLQSQFEIQTVMRVPAGAFLPPPKVDSTILEFVPKADQFTPDYFRLIRHGFAQPRKTLVNNLVAGYRAPRETAVRWVTALGQKETVRPAELTLSEWDLLAQLVATIS